jgi:hypothetical protein
MTPTNNKISYNELKSKIFDKYVNNFSYCLWTNNKYSDFYVMGFKFDYIVKLITPLDDKDKIIKYWKNNSTFWGLKRKVILLNIDIDNKSIISEEEFTLK